MINNPYVSNLIYDENGIHKSETFYSPDLNSATNKINNRLDILKNKEIRDIKVCFGKISKEFTVEKTYVFKEVEQKEHLSVEI